MTKPLKLFVTPSSALIFAFVFISFILFYAANIQAAPTSPDINQQRHKIAKLTAELNRLLQSYRHASSDEQIQIEQQLTHVASERQLLLGQVVKTEPQTVLRYALPDKVQQQFPDGVKQKFERWVHAQGELEVFFEDHEQVKNNRLQFYLKQEHKRFELSVAGDHHHKATSGQSVHVQGVLVNTGEKAIIATSEEQLMLAAGGSGDPDTSSAPATLEYTTGEQRTAVFLINFQDTPGNKPWSVADMNQRFFTQINNFFLENSYQQTWLTGDILGWYTLPVNSTDSCDQWGMADAADAIATANNVDLSQYDRYVYIFPNNSCSWSGFATVGGTQTRAWVNGVPYSKVPAHEIGHNFGLLHAHGLNCEGDVTDTNCVSITYGDQLDTMGAQPGHFNAFEKERLGWLNQSQTPPIVTVEQAGSYAIEHFESTSANAKALKIYRDIDPATGSNRWYYIEFRQPVGEDQFIVTDPYLNDANISKGVIVRLGSDNDGNSSYLLDMTPESTTFSGNFADLYDPALVAGNSYTDSATGLSITTEHTDSQSATVYVSFNGGGGGSPSCSYANPQLSISPIESQWVAAGSQVDFTVNVTNQDSSSCDTSRFDITSALPSGWSANTPQISLAPGQSGSAVLSVTSGTEAVDGFYELPVTVTNSNQADYSQSQTVSYVVSDGSANTAPDAANDDAVMTTVEPIVIDVLFNDSDADNDPIYISAVGSAAKGDVSVNANGTLLYTPAKRFKDSDSFSYTISDGQASDTATVSLSLQSSGDSSEGDNTTKGGGNGGGKGGGKPN